MSRIGKLPVKIPENLTVQKEDSKLKVLGGKNQLVLDILKGLEVEVKEDEVQITPKDKSKETRSNWGTMRSILSNAVTGLKEGFQKTLILEGVGYRITEQGDGLKMNLGYSHSLEYKKPEGIEFELEGNNQLTIKGFDKQKVGQVAAKIRNLRPVEPYKGKGFHYSDEVVRRKAGKKAVTGK